MDFDDIVIGSGLAALATVMGLPRQSRVLILAGPQAGQLGLYGSSVRVPAWYLGHGGLGNYWHGVIPTGLGGNFPGLDEERFARFFARFYPRTSLQWRLRQPWLFVPWRAIRPAREWPRLLLERGRQLEWRNDSAQQIEAHGAGMRVVGSDGSPTGRRLWLAAGALHTAQLLARAISPSLRRGFVSDHAIVYLGQVRHAPRPTVQHTREGVFMAATASASGEALLSLRPAHFAFRQLDRGVDERAVFGLPAAGIVSKLLRRMSPGLFCEALYNRTGLLASAQVHSVYAQVVVPDAYETTSGDGQLAATQGRLRRITDALREDSGVDGLIPSRRPDFHVPGIHLHHSVDCDALARADIDGPDSAIRIVDASARRHIGGEHHSFKVMVSAFERAAAVE